VTLLPTFIADPLWEQFQRLLPERTSTSSSSDMADRSVLLVTRRTWEAIEAWSAAEVERGARRPAIPPMVKRPSSPSWPGLSSVQRIYQLEAERKAGRRSHFPAPALKGYWLRSVGEHWTKTQKTRLGPTPRTSRDR
jgi:hypothetical protein